MKTDKTVSIVMDGYNGPVHMLHVGICQEIGYKYEFIGVHEDVEGVSYSVYKSEHGILFYGAVRVHEEN